MKRKLCSLFLAGLLLAGCSNAAVPAETVPAEPLPQEDHLEETLAEIHNLGKSPDDQYRTYYEVFVYSFCDSNGDGIGDIPGLISKLDYLQNLGITGLWLMPVHPSPSYHKYDVEDYYAIDPAYGTMEDYDFLLQETEKRGMKVIMDLVLNHTGAGHPWFQTACRYLAELEPDQEPDPDACRELSFYHFQKSSSCPEHCHPVPGTENYFYEGVFSDSMPDLNFDSEPLRNEIEKVMEFWLQKGVDGFRLDAAKEFYSGQTEKNLEVLSWIQTSALSIDPECYLVAEVWDSFMAISQYYESGITSLFDFAFGGSDGKTAKVLWGAGNASLVSSYAEAQEKADAAFRKKNPNFIDAPFFSNHDVGRIAGFVGRDPAKTKLAGAMNLFMSGNAFIYYGEELGMVCGSLEDPSYRAPMLWNDSRDNGTAAPPPGCVLPEEYPFGSLETQAADPDSVYNYYRQAIAIRNAIPSIARGVSTVEATLNQGSVSACRKLWQEDTSILLMNISEEAEDVDLCAYEDFLLAATLSADGGEIWMEDYTLHLPPFGAAVLLKK